jgi:hypothetical protein
MKITLWQKIWTLNSRIHLQRQKIIVTTTTQADSDDESTVETPPERQWTP